MDRSRHPDRSADGSPGAEIGASPGDYWTDRGPAYGGAISADYPADHEPNRGAISADYPADHEPNRGAICADYPTDHEPNRGAISGANRCSNGIPDGNAHNDNPSGVV